ncbi:ExbD/TolR family protein [Prosthecobacter vanneervenii]|uniref:Biopolymer transport protein ExbD n=1 Tax=Prosthecobacter vanneervenii TaxID=48466 RepID=A0A7W8DJE0_9BACT|nr:biopolymer transporter ExbD [Prosthecobacter vanneervenii]MBB5031982.1 biopolymer transport protein ExbD [Prosthecobacter vanneervenii]
MKLESHLPRQSPWLYIVPLMNTILLLLVFFLLNSNFVVQSGIHVDKPQSSSRLTGFDRAHIITIPAGLENALYFDGVRTSTAELRDKLKASREGERRAIIHAARQAPHGRVIEVGNIALELGYEVAYSTVPPKA